MNDKPLDVVGFPHQAGMVGKHDFQQRTVNDEGYEIVPERRGKKGIQCGKCGMKFDYGKAYNFCCPNRGSCPVNY